MSAEPLAPEADAGTPRPTPRATTLRDTVARRVTIDSLWILIGYAVTSGSGFLFWIVAARMIEPAQLGIDTAVYAIFTAAAAVAASGVGDGLLVMLPISGASRARLLRWGIGIDVVVAAVAGTIAGVFALVVVGTSFPVPLTIAGVAAATIVWSLFVIKDPILQALGRADRAAALNGIGNVAKLVLLIALGALGFAATLNIVVLAIFLPVLVTTAIAYLRAVRRSMAAAESADRHTDVPEPVECAPVDWMASNRRFFSVFVARDGAASALYVGVALLLPFLVTALSGPAQGAMFGLCFQLVLVLDLVALAVGASFSTHSAASGTAAGSVIRVWIRVLGVVALGAVALVALSPVILTLMRPYYVQHGGVMIILVLAVASVLRTSYEMWGASLRAQHRSIALLVANGCQAVVLIVLCAVVIPLSGAIGAAWCLFAVTALMSTVGLIGMLRTRAARVTP